MKLKLLANFFVSFKLYLKIYSNYKIIFYLVATVIAIYNNFLLFKTRSSLLFLSNISDSFFNSVSIKLKINSKLLFLEFIAFIPDYAIGKFQSKQIYYKI